MLPPPQKKKKQRKEKKRKNLHKSKYSGYGFPGHEGDANDYWIVEIDQEQSEEGEARTRLQTLRSKIRLLHPLQSCALFSHPIALPEWGFRQQEVTCIQNGKKPKTMWVIEETRNDLCKCFDSFPLDEQVSSPPKCIQLTLAFALINRD